MVGGVTTSSLRATHTSLSTATLFCRQEQHTPIQHASRGPASALLQTATPRIARLPTAAELCYSNISAFARQHIRSFRTNNALPREVGSRRRDQVASTRKTDVVDRKEHVLYQHGLKLAARRQVAMTLERERLANHIKHAPGLNVKDFLKQGKYRSLRRRISNLERWEETILDLRIKRTQSTKPLNTIRAFAALDRSLYLGVGRYTRKIVIRHDPRCPRWSAQLFQGTAKHESSAAWKNWVQFDIHSRKRSYQRLLIYILDRKPGRAVQFLHVLANDPLLRGRKTELIADALGHLSKIHCRGKYELNEGWSSDFAAVRRSFVPAFVHIFRKALAGMPEVCSQDLLYNLVDLASTQELKKVFDCLIQHRTFLGFDTVLHYANAFANAGDFAYALECLRELKKILHSTVWDNVSDRQRLRWTCALILRKSMAKGEGYHNTPKIVAAIVRLGIQMDITLYNVVMHNAMNAGDHSTAFKVYNTLEKNELKPDKFTHSILLHGCASQSNPGMFTEFAQHCAEVAREIEDPWLATDYIHFLYVRHQDDSDKEQTLDLLQQQYLRFFSPRSLQLVSSRVTKIASWMSNYFQSQGAPVPDKHFSPNLTPPPVALYIMLQAQLQAAQALSTQQVLNLYNRFKLHVQHDSDPALTRLASHPIIWNAFLLAFCTKQQFASASQLIKDMTEMSPQPNIYSWNIFMQAFFKTSQVQAAERVFEILRSRGVDPDGFTYGVLLRGYAKAQHVERIGETMQHVDSAAEMDPDLLRLLARVTNRNNLMLTLEKVRMFKEVQAQEKAKAEAEEEVERWKEPPMTDDELALALPRFLESTPAESASKEATVDKPAPEDRDTEYTPDFLKPSSLDPEPEPWLETPQSVPPPPPPSSPLNPHDPEVQYRQLQERLGSGTLPTQPETFGATLGFTSMLPDPSTIKKVVKTQPEKAVQTRPKKVAWKDKVSRKREGARGKGRFGR